MKAVILCAGFATRLQPLTLNQPKPLLPIAGRPILEYILDHVQKLDAVDEILIVGNEKFNKNFTDWVSGYQSNKKIIILNDGSTDDSNKLGAVGDIHFAINKQQLDEDILVIAGDNLFDFDLTDLVSLFQEKKSSTLALYDVKEKELIKGRYGAVSIDENNKVTKVVEKPQDPETTLASTACYIFSKDDIHILTEAYQQADSLDNLGEFVRMLVTKKDVYAVVYDGAWYDIGDKEQLKIADDAWQKK